MDTTKIELTGSELTTIRIALETAIDEYVDANNKVEEKHARFVFKKLYGFNYNSINSSEMNDKLL